MVSYPAGGVVIVVASVPAVRYATVEKNAHGLVCVQPLAAISLIVDDVSCVNYHFDVVGVFVFYYPLAEVAEVGGVGFGEILCVGYPDYRKCLRGICVGGEERGDW